MLISIDGLKPEAVLEAASHGLEVRNLRAFLADGVYSTGVHGVLPTVTYPSHMTILTGVSPARHGIYSNTTFDPLRRNDHGWYWYAEDVKVPTLWDAAAAARLKTANIYWPTSVGANITYNLPQVWRAGSDDDLKLQRALSTPGLEQHLSAGLGRYPGGMEEAVAEDEIRARFAIRLIETKHPDFITVYLAGLGVGAPAAQVERLARASDGPAGHYWRRGSVAGRRHPHPSGDRNRTERRAIPRSDRRNRLAQAISPGLHRSGRDRNCPL
jgi:Type I phosphodiesterase / nucleotide pyrophosphatase